MIIQKKIMNVKKFVTILKNQNKQNEQFKLKLQSQRRRLNVQLKLKLRDNRKQFSVQFKLRNRRR